MRSTSAADSEASVIVGGDARRNERGAHFVGFPAEKSKLETGGEKACSVLERNAHTKQSVGNKRQLHSYRLPAIPLRVTLVALPLALLALAARPNAKI